MRGPRRQLPALISRLEAVPERPLIVVEGESDRDAIKIWIRQNQLNADVYQVGDFEVALKDKYADYGGNKGRILSLSLDIANTVEACDNFIGLVDRDMDSLLERVVDIDGIHYTNGASLFCHVATVDDVKYVFETVFRRTLTDNFAGLAVAHAVKFLSLRSALWRCGKGSSLVDIKRYVGENFSFDWEGYIRAVSLKNRFCRPLLEEHLNSTVNDAFIDYHFFVEFLWRAAKKVRSIPDSVTVDEVYRNFFHRYVMRTGTCPTLDQLSVKCA